MTFAIEAAGLVKRFGKTLAVDGVDLAVRPGMVAGLLGPNGAGKTTVVRMLATLLRPDAAKGIFDRFRSLPIARSAPLTGTITGDFFRCFISVAMVFAYGSLLGFRVATNPAFALAAVGLMFVFGFAAGWIWVLLGLYVKSPQSLQGFGFIVMFPLTFGSNVFIPAATLPGWLQGWVKPSPVTALAGTSRGLMLGGGVATPAWHFIAWSISITAVFAPLAVRRYRRIG